VSPPNRQKEDATEISFRGMLRELYIY